MWCMKPNVLTETDVIKQYKYSKLKLKPYSSDLFLYKFHSHWDSFCAIHQFVCKSLSQDAQLKRELSWCWLPRHWIYMREGRKGMGTWITQEALFEDLVLFEVWIPRPLKGNLGLGQEDLSTGSGRWVSVHRGWLCFGNRCMSLDV